MLYLLHGRGDSMSAWTQMKSTLDELIAAEEIPPTIAIMPDAPWSTRASYYVDSAYKGADPGRPVETAFTRDLIQHVDAAYRTVADRSGRGIAGYSMGGYGAMRYSLAHPDLFGAAVVLSPAVYFPEPPLDSSTREFGAFGKGKKLFVEKIYKQLNYPATFGSFEATGLPQRMFIAVGDDEFKNTNPRDFEHDLDFEAHVLFNKAQRVSNLTSELRVVDGGHDWDVWGPQFIEGAKYIFEFLKPPPVLMKAKLTGTTGEERAGGVATDAAGNVYQALAAGGSVNGQPFAGDKDLVLRSRRRTARPSGRARSARLGSSGPTASPSTRRATWSSPGTPTGIWTALTPATRRTTSSSSSTTPTETVSGCDSSACRGSPTAAMRSPRMRPETSTSPGTRAATWPVRTRATRTSIF